MRITRRSFITGVAALPLIRALDAGAAAPGRLHGHSLLGKVKYAPGFAHFAYVNPTAPKGGRVVLGAGGGFDSFNDQIEKGDPAPVGEYIYDTLMTGSLDEGSTHYGLLAEWLEEPEDSTWVTFKLRDQARFHDGSKVTADDVAWTLETLKTKGDPRWRQYYANISGAKALAPDLVRFDFDQKGNRELSFIVGQMPVLPKAWWASRDFGRSGTDDKPLGSGPYRIGRFETNRFIEFERVKDYWAADLPTRKGTQNFDLIRIEYFADDTVMFEAFKAGSIDFRAENSSLNWATKYDFPAVKEGRVKKRELRTEGPKPVQAFCLNLRRAKFADRRVRQAFALAFDFEWTNKKFYYEQYARPSSYFQGSPDLMAQGVPTGEELALLEPFRQQLPPELFTQPFALPVTDGSGNIRGQLRQARELLEAAGCKLVAGKLLAPDGQPFTAEFLSSSELQGRIILPYVENLKKLGIDASFRVVDGPQYIARVVDQKPDFDIILWSVANSESPGNEQRNFWSSSAADMQGSRNRAGVRDSVVDTLIEKLIFAPDRARLAAACRALDRVLLWQWYLVPQLYTPFERLAWWDRFGHPDPLPGRNHGFPDIWWAK